MKIEMKGLRRNFSKDKPESAKNNARHRMPSLNSSTKRSSHLATKLPSLPDPPLSPPATPPPPQTVPEDSNQPNTKLTITVTRATQGRRTQKVMQAQQKEASGGGISNPNSASSRLLQANTAASTPSTPSSKGAGERAENSTPHMSIVGIGEGKRPLVTTPRNKTHSIGGSKGHLSQGWSPPQPIGPLRGNPIYASPRSRGNAGGGVDQAREHQKSGMVASPTASMVINLNVNEFLTETEKTDQK